MSARESKRIPRRAAWLAAVAVIAIMATWHGGGRTAQAWLTPPSSFTVSQSAPTGPNVAPGDPINFTVNIDLASSATSLIIQGTLNTGLRFAATPFDAPYDSGLCSLTSSQLFTCTIPNQGTGPITALLVHAVAANVPDTTSITQLANTFSVKDGLVGVPVTAPASDLATLTVQNEKFAVTDSLSPASVFEGLAVTHTIGLTNNGAANSGNYDISVTVANGTVTNIVCPAGGGGTGSLTSVASCANQAGLAPTATGTMTVTVLAADGAGSTTMSNTVAITPSAGNNTGAPLAILLAAGAQLSPASATTILELNLSGGGSVAAGQTVTVCTTNNPNNVAQVKSANTPASPTLVLADFAAVPSGGAAVSGLVAASGGACGLNQSGVSFTSASGGTVSVYGSYNKTGSLAVTTNTVTITFSAAGTPTPTPTNTPTPTPTGTTTPTPTATPTGTTTASPQLVVATPPQGIAWARSRLTFSATTGTLSPVTRVQFIVKRKSDNKYWNATVAAWQDAIVLNDGAAPSGAGATTWTFAITGVGRRLFVNTTVTVEARATSGSTVYSSQVIPEIPVR